MKRGICTLANDSVYDQVVALINSIEMHAGSAMPVCIYPYDGHLSKLREFVAEHPQVHIFDEQAVIARWDAWVEQIWNYHPSATQTWMQANGTSEIHRLGTHRRLCAFEGPFDEFIYMDADTLLLDSPTPVFEALETFDWVTYDFQHKDLSHVFNITSKRLTQLFPETELKQKCFCSGFYASRRNSINENDVRLFMKLLMEGDAEVLYPMAPDQTILNYFVLRKPLNSVNLALSLSPEMRTGNSVTSSHFRQQKNLLFDKNVRLLYLHFIGISSRFFARLCQGENIDFPYRDIFLHYRYLKHPEALPKFVSKAIPYQSEPVSLRQKLFRKLGFIH